MKSERQATGKKGGVVLQVYIAAFIAPQGLSLLQIVGGQHAPWVIRDVSLFGVPFLSRFPSLNFPTKDEFKGEPSLKTEY
jgi:hypothetical protein